MIGLVKFFGHIIKNNFALIEHGNRVGHVKDVINNMGDNDSSKIVVVVSK